MFAKFFESELAYLRERGTEFASGPYQAAARLHDHRGGDPDVERLLEGFAFLTARIRERVDDAVPDIVHGLCELLLPHYLRTIPAIHNEVPPHKESDAAIEHISVSTKKYMAAKDVAGK